MIERHGVLPPVVERLTSGIRQAGQLSKQFVSNTVDMLRGRLVPYQGLGNLLPLFYESIVKQTDPPVPDRLAIAVSEAEDAVLAQTGRMDLPIVHRALKSASDRRWVVVTGATGFLGREVVAHLIKRGYALRTCSSPESHRRVGSTGRGFGLWRRAGFGQPADRVRRRLDRSSSGCRNARIGAVYPRKHRTRHGERRGCRGGSLPARRSACGS